MPLLSTLVSPTSSIVSNSQSQPVPTTVADATLALEEVAFYLSKLVKMSESLAVVDTAQRQRVTVDNVTSNAALPSVVRDNAGVNVFNQFPTVYTAANLNTLGNYGGIPDFWRQVDVARNNYQNSIRSNLTFS